MVVIKVHLLSRELNRIVSGIFSFGLVLGCIQVGFFNSLIIKCMLSVKLESSCKSEIEL